MAQSTLKNAKNLTNKIMFDWLHDIFSPNELTTTTYYRKDNRRAIVEECAEYVSKYAALYGVIGDVPEEFAEDMIRDLTTLPKERIT